MCPDNLRMRATRVLRDEFRDVVDFEIILHARNQVPYTSWLPSVVVSLFEGGAILLLLIVGQGENPFSQTKLGVDFFLAQAIIFDVEKPCTPA